MNSIYIAFSFAHTQNKTWGWFVYLCVCEQQFFFIVFFVCGGCCCCCFKIQLKRIDEFALLLPNYAHISIDLFTEFGALYELTEFIYRFLFFVSLFLLCMSNVSVKDGYIRQALSTQTFRSSGFVRLLWKKHKQFYIVYTKNINIQQFYRFFFG